MPAPIPVPIRAARPARVPTLALSLFLPLVLAGTASAQTSWVDPPARTAATPDSAKAPRDAATADQPHAPAAAAGHAGPAQAAETQAAETHAAETKAARTQAGGTGRDGAPVRQAARPEAGEEALPKAVATPAPAPRRAAALERPAGREPLRHHAHHPRRLADTPAAGAAPAAASSERAAAARELTARYLATVSGPDDTMVGAASSFYGTRVRFYGRPITTAGLVAEKRSFVQRWPERRYAPRAIRSACDTQTCTIRTIVDFRTANPGRGAVSSGEAELVLEVGFAGTRPYIIGETGRVLRRSIQAGTLAASPGKA
jgi:hypothetical protein